MSVKTGDVVLACHSAQGTTEGTTYNVVDCYRYGAWGSVVHVLRSTDGAELVVRDVETVCAKVDTYHVPTLGEMLDTYC